MSHIASKQLQRIGILSFIFITLLIGAFLQFQTVLAQSSFCHTMARTSSVPVGFASPFNVLSASKEALITVICANSSSATVSVGNGSDVQIVYKNGYVLKNGAWSPISYTGNTKNGDWYVGEASAKISSTAGKEGTVLAYICTWSGSEWKCGCRDANCVTSSWNIQTFKMPELNANPPVPTPPKSAWYYDYTHHKWIKGRFAPNLSYSLCPGNSGRFMLDDGTPFTPPSMPSSGRYWNCPTEANGFRNGVQIEVQAEVSAGPFSTEAACEASRVDRSRISEGGSYAVDPFCKKR